MNFQELTKVMVSTRGAKVKFNEGERVLCYEPDPTKAKVLYDSKVLQVFHSKDPKGRKNLEYLIHFQGWKDSWDRTVPEDFVLKCTEENRELQKELAEKAHIKLSIKSNRVLIGPGYSKHKKRHRRLSETIRETLERERRNKAESDTSSKTGVTDDDMSSLTSDMGSSTGIEDEEDDENRYLDLEDPRDGLTDEEAIAKDIPLTFPENLKNILVRDFYQINEKNKLVNLPSERNVLSILEDYVKFFAVRYLARTSEKRRSEFKEKDKTYMTLDLCKEFVDGVRICFDFYLHALLLYAKERSQAERLKKALPIKTEKKQDAFIPISLSKDQSFPQDDAKERHSKFEKEEKKAAEELPRRVLRSQKPAGEDSSLPSPTSPSTPAVVTTPGLSLENKETTNTRATHPTHSHSCESGRSTPSTITSGMSAFGCFSLNGENLPPHLEAFSLDFRNWTLLPDAHRNPPPPVLLYGPIHLLRLFVKMPEILYRMNISPERRKILINHMDMFLEYLNLHNQAYFSETLYVNNTD